MDHSEAGVIAFLKAKADTAWKEKKPYFLSSVAPEMKIAEGIDYREILGDEKLKAFVKRTESEGGYRLVEHPVRKAMVGIVPTQETFEFTDKSAAEMPPPTKHHSTRAPQELALVNFLRALSDLSDEEIESVVIPTNVLVKLIRRQ